MTDPTAVVTVALVGVGGYGETYLPTLLNPPPSAGLRLVAGVDPFADRSTYAAELKARGVPLLSSLEAVYERLRPDLVILVSPIQFHCEQTVLALSHGSHVLCEKPLAATVDQVHRMRAARDAAGRSVAVGFQWSFCPVIHALKADILAGRFGTPKRLRTQVLWPRGHAYYHRNRWAGRTHDDAGRPVFDSPVNNAAAHFLHNMFYLLGDAPAASARPASVTAELYRANAIESYDTAVLRCTTDAGVPVHFAVTHATPQTRPITAEYEFELGTIRLAAGDRFIATFADGRTTDYGPACGSRSPVKLLRVIDDVRRGTPTPCGIEAALPHVQAVEAALASSGGVHAVPAGLVRTVPAGDSTQVVFDGVADALDRCYAGAALPAELGIPWAVGGRPTAVAG